MVNSFEARVSSIRKRGSTTGGAGGAPSNIRDVMTVLSQVNLFIIAKPK